MPKGQHELHRLEASGEAAKRSGREIGFEPYITWNTTVDAIITELSLEFLMYGFFSIHFFRDTSTTIIF